MQKKKLDTIIRAVLLAIIFGFILKFTAIPTENILLYIAGIIMGVLLVLFVL